MNIIGKWKVAFVAAFDENGHSWLKPDDYRAAHKDEPEDTEKTLGTILEFAEGGNLLYCTPIPAGISQEQIDEAVKSGEINVKDGYMYMVQKWKEEDGKFFCDSEIQGEVLGEEISSWVELKIEDDGTMNFMSMLRFEKI